ncbi:Golgi-associated plant pathogenesis-related protein 1 [Tetrabaena socialis]|uniref:Golgi-associated plant pathogenesis-related protein 1 n=1 Tax=Tetrabaena socialis TaxID=47790 RepID=A0A2J8ABU0_9CHLO|nr:Golgi-associated plant pathogenesis-related protein 1 [Tetrabaena socialis]|eukprot:PNH09992.1 Golgi-associated plant pathogenesis-related protein 1 [Tetrabaena socialis]
MCHTRRWLHGLGRPALHHYRAKHQAPALVWNSSLAAECRSWAAGLAANGCGLVHSPKIAWPDGYSENLYALWMGGGAAPPATCKPAAAAWYNEVRYYNFATTSPFTQNWPPYNNNTVGHFTALVWKASGQLGCGMATAPVMRTYYCKAVVCRYRAQSGNIATDSFFAANVLPPI